MRPYLLILFTILTFAACGPKKQEEAEEFTLFAPLVEGEVLTPAELDSRISDHKGEK